MAFAWVALLAFIRLSTKVGLFPHPLTVDESMDRVDAWLKASPGSTGHPLRSDQPFARFGEW